VVVVEIFAGRDFANVAGRLEDGFRRLLRSATGILVQPNGMAESKHPLFRCKSREPLHNNGFKRTESGNRM
jgi:hypothetical protein